MVPPAAQARAAAGVAHQQPRSNNPESRNHRDRTEGGRPLAGPAREVTPGGRAPRSEEGARRRRAQGPAKARAGARAGQNGLVPRAAPNANPASSRHNNPKSVITTQDLFGTGF